MNKLTEIKENYERAKKRSTPAIGKLYYSISMDDLGYLISLLEEKDKALAFYEDEKNYFRKPQDQLTFIEADFGKLARKALNTSSNNEGETI